MHRGVIEGDIFVTSYLRDQIEERRLQHPFNGLGRIYRLVYTGRPARAPELISRDANEEWVKRLAHPNGFWRDTAQRILVENGDRKSVPAIRTMALEHASELARLHAWWTLEGLAALTPELVERALRDESPKVRVAGLRLAEPFLGNATVAKAVSGLANDTRFEVRRQLVFTLGEGKDDEFYAALLKLVQKDLGRPAVVEAAVSGLRGRELATIERVLGDASWAADGDGAKRFLSALAQSVVNSENAAETESLLKRIAGGATQPTGASLAMLDGLIAHPKMMAKTPDALAALEKSGDADIATRSAKLKAAWTKAASSRTNRGPTSEDLERGKALYPICGACHGPEGKGLPGMAPPLDTSAVVANSLDDLIKGILLGRNLDRSNKAFADMPSFAGLPDADIAAIATYVRSQWGPPSRSVPIGRIRQLRQEVGAPAGPGATETPPSAPAPNRVP
jgi:mono/diheme cytochrome c family protein